MRNNYNYRALIVALSLSGSFFLLGGTPARAADEPSLTPCELKALAADIPATRFDEATKQRKFDRDGVLGAINKITDETMHLFAELKETVGSSGDVRELDVLARLLDQQSLATLFRDAGVSVVHMKEAIGKLPPPPAGAIQRKGSVYSLLAVIDRATEEAALMGHKYATPAHMFLALNTREFAESDAGKILLAQGVSLPAIRQAVERTLKGGNLENVTYTLASKEVVMANGETGENAPVDITKFTKNKTLADREKHKAGKVLDEAIGPQAEKIIDKMLSVLQMKLGSRNPLLIGEAGSGKTATVNELSRRLALGEVPDHFKDREVLIVDLAAMVAGTKYRGEFEKKIKALLDYLEANPHLIAFIDEAHMIGSAGKTSEGGGGAGDQLKPAMSSWLELIGATTLDEFTRFIQADPALERRFFVMTVQAATEGEMVEIVNRVASKVLVPGHLKDLGIEVKYDEADLALIGEHTAEYGPHNLVDPGRTLKLTDVIFARIAVKAAELRDIEVTIKDLEAKLAGTDLETSAREAMVRTVDRLKSKLPALEKYREARVTPEIIAEIYELYFEIKVRVGKEAARAARAMPERLGAKVIGQPAAWKALAEPLVPRKLGIVTREGVPLSYLFVGPKGAGMSYLAETFAKDITGRSDMSTAMLTIDCSQYNEDYMVSRLVGNEGSTEPGLLAKTLRKNPGAVVHFKNLGSGSRKLKNLVLAMIKDGRVVTGLGTDLIVRNMTVIVSLEDAALVDVADEAYMNNLSQTLSGKGLDPSFMNEFHAVVPFGALSNESLEQIANLAVAEGNIGLIKRTGLSLKLESSAIQMLLEYNIPETGPLGLQRTLEGFVLKPLANGILDDKIEGDRRAAAPRIITVEVEGGEVIFKDGSNVLYKEPLGKKPVAPKKPAPGMGGGDSDMAEMLRQARGGGGAGMGGPAAGSEQPQEPLIIEGGSPRRVIERSGGNFNGVSLGVPGQQ